MSTPESCRCSRWAMSTVAILLWLHAAFCRADPSNALALSGTPAVVNDLPPIVPLKLLLGNSKYRNPQLSPDGTNLAYIRPSGKSEVYNVFIKKLPTAAQVTANGTTEVSLFAKEGVAIDRQVTFDDTRGVTTYSWSEDGSQILYIQDNNGDENDHLYTVPLITTGQPKAIDLTPFKGVKASGIVSSKRFPDLLYIGLNKRDPEVFDMYSLDLKTRKLELDTINPGDVASWILDYDFKIVGSVGYNNTDGASYVNIKDTPTPAAAAAAAAASIVTESAPSNSTQQQQQQKQKQTGSRKLTLLDPITKPGTPKPTVQIESIDGSSGSSAAGPGSSSSTSNITGNVTYQQWVIASASKTDASVWRRLITWPFGEDGGVFRMNKAGDAIYIVSSLGRDTTAFQLISTSPGGTVLQNISSDPLVNIGSVLFDQDSWEPQMISYSYLQTNWTVLDPTLEKDWDLIVRFRPGQNPSITDISNDKKTWVLLYGGDNTTSRYYLYRRGSWPPQLLLEVQPDLNPYKLAKMHSVVIPARDGLRLPAYLSLPVKPGVPQVLPESVRGDIPKLELNSSATVSPHFGPKPPEAEALDVRRPKPLNLSLPLILYVHGGPWARDYWGADSVVQWLVNRGYAVLQVNYRGSTGYGKAFMNAGNKQWGIGSMQQDLTDSVKWAIDKGIADPKKVCIFGGSYGGYATLAGLAFTPELYACGVDLVGISNLATFMKSIPSYWKPLKYEWLTRVGDVENNATLNRELSPFYHTDKIRAPLLIGQGANDPRVPQPESDQMFNAMKKSGKDVTYVLYSDEGHGLLRADNRLDFYSRADRFFSKHLGGRAEAFYVQPRSSAKVINQTVTNSTANH